MPFPESRPQNFGVPADRWYSTGHTWIQPIPETPASWRFGIDAFVASFLGTAQAVQWCEPTGVACAGQPVCDVVLSIGVLRIALPIDARVERVNFLLDHEVLLLATDPYAEGWIAEISSQDAWQVDNLSSAAAARRQIELDVRRLTMQRRSAQLGPLM